MAVMAQSLWLEAQVHRQLSVEVQNPPLLSLELDRSHLELALPSTFQRQPIEKTGAGTIIIHSNISWELIMTVSGDLINQDNPALTIPCSRLEYRLRSAETSVSNANYLYQPLTTNAPVTIASGGPTPDIGIRLHLDLRLVMVLSDPAGSYGLTLTYSLNPKQ